MKGNSGKLVIALAGNPNSGKTTLFNALTGSTQRVGNWPGVTVEKKSGVMRLGERSAEVVDLPGIYSLSSHSDDERVARDYLLSGEADAVINIVDASNLERNLFLTLNLLEMKVPVYIVLNMTDLAAKRGFVIDPAVLSRRLGVPVTAMSATKAADIVSFRKDLESSVDVLAGSPFKVPYPETVENILSVWGARLGDVSTDLGVDRRWLALKLLEQDSFYSDKVIRLGVFSDTYLSSGMDMVIGKETDSPDAVIAAAKYACIRDLVDSSRTGSVRNAAAATTSAKIDRVVLNRYLGIPVFLAVMYLMFAFVINIGGAFIDFFDILFGAVFVDGFGAALESAGAPQWLVSLLAGGIGAGIQTVATFVPIMFAMFLALSLLEDSGYMARAAFVMDRALRSIGLPGKAFIPMIVGFGCTVPAIMATRTLENKRDRYITVFMAPFMSCGARLPVYALFGVAFFGRMSGLIVMSVYLAGIILAVVTGLILKNTLFRGEPAPFIMELPPYHVPRFGSVLHHVWMRLRGFIVRAGKVIILVVALLGVLNSVGTDGSFGNEDSPESVLSALGKTITPVFGPMGIDRENWPATVGMFTGLFAKEAVVGTLNGLYGQIASLNAPEEGESDETEEAWSFAGEVGAAFMSIPEAFVGLGDTLRDPLGLSVVSGDEDETAESIEADPGLFTVMRGFFNNDKHAAYAYMLFILIYFPCVAALGALIREIGPLFGWVSVTYLTVLAWITATLYYQITVGHELVWIVTPVVLFGMLIGAFALLRRAVQPEG